MKITKKFNHDKGYQKFESVCKIFEIAFGIINYPESWQKNVKQKRCF